MKELKIANPFGAPVRHVERCSSTMTLIRELLTQGLAHGTVVVSDFQEEGRGRIPGRQWASNPGENLLFSIYLAFPAAIPPALSLRTGLALARAVEDFIPPLAGALMIKWPNDVMIFEKKASGILIEASGGSVILGIGINYSQLEFPAGIAQKATSLGLALKTLGQGETNLFAGIIGDAAQRFILLEKILSRLCLELEGNAGNWHGELDRRLYKKGEIVRFIPGRAGPEEAVEGRLAGIGSSGELLIAPNGVEEPLAFVSGELLPAQNNCPATLDNSN